MTDVIFHGKIETTEARAKELRRHVDKLITKSKKDDLHSRRKVESLLRPISKNDMPIGKYLFEKIAPKYKNRNGGYTRIIKSPNRKGDNAPMAILELV
jgi:large subunit ribosomal protein L17